MCQMCLVCLLSVVTIAPTLANETILIPDNETKISNKKNKAKSAKGKKQNPMQTKMRRLNLLLASIN